MMRKITSYLIFMLAGCIVILAFYKWNDNPKNIVAGRRLTVVLYIIPAGKGEDEKVALKNTILEIEGARQNVPSNQLGTIVIDLLPHRSPGTDIIIGHNVADHKIIHPDLKGRLRIPADDAPIEVWMVHKDAKFILTNGAIRRFVEDITKKTNDELRNNIDNRHAAFAKEIRDLAAEHHLVASEVTTRIDDWSNAAILFGDPVTRAYAAFYRGEYLHAERYFLEDAEKNSREAEQLYLKSASSYELAGDTMRIAGEYPRAVRHYASAADIYRRIDNSDRMENALYKQNFTKILSAAVGDPEKSLETLTAVIGFYREKLNVLRRDTVEGRYKYGKAQYFLGFALTNQMYFTHGKLQLQCLVDAITAFDEALNNIDISRDPTDWGVARYKKAIAQGLLGSLLGERTGVEQIQVALTGFDEAEKIFPETGRTAEWADIRLNKGMLLASYAFHLRGDERRQRLIESDTAFHSAESVFTQDKSKYEWAFIQNNLAINSNIHAEWSTSNTVARSHAEKSEKYIQNASPVYTKAARPQDWANLQNTLGVLRQVQSRYEPGELAVQRLKDAQDAHNRSLEVFTKSFPNGWGRSNQYLGLTLHELGKRSPVPRRQGLYDQSLKFLRSAMDQYDRGRFPYEWANIKYNEGIVHLSRAEIQSTNQGKSECLQQARSSFIGSLEVFDPKSSPAQWASAMQNLAVSYKAIGEMIGGSTGQEEMAKAIQLYDGIYDVYPKKDLPISWAIIANDQGSAKQSLGKLLGVTGIRELKEARTLHSDTAKIFEDNSLPAQCAKSKLLHASTNLELGMQVAGNDGNEFLSESELSYLGALSVLKKDEFPNEWARIKTGLGCVYYTMSLRDINKKKKLLLDSIQEFTDSQRIFNRNHFPIDWALQEYNIGYACQTIGEQVESEDGIEWHRKALKRYQNVLEVFSPEFQSEYWERSIYNSAAANWYLWSRDIAKNDLSCLKAAVSQRNEFLKHSSLARSQQRWALTNVKLANELLTLGLKQTGEASKKTMKESTEANLSALQYYKRETHAADWAEINFIIGHAWFELSSRADGDERKSAFEDAERYFTLSLEVFTQEKYPAAWANAHMNIADALVQSAGLLRQGREDLTLKDALDHYKLSSHIFTQDKNPEQYTNLKRKIKTAETTLNALPKK